MRGKCSRWGDAKTVVEELQTAETWCLYGVYRVHKSVKICRNLSKLLESIFC